MSLPLSSTPEDFAFSRGGPEPLLINISVHLTPTLLIDTFSSLV